MRLLLKLAAILACLAPVSLSSSAQAQGQFTPVITINDSVITRYELTQRKRLLELFRTTGDIDKQAREGLIEDRLKQQEMDRVGLRLTDGALQTALDEFAGRANMNYAQFSNLLRQNSIDPATLRDFVKIGVSWRDYVRSRYGRRVDISEADIDRALARRGGSTTAIEVLLSEIIIPAPPPQAARAQQVAERIARLRSYAAFEAAAREVSALPSRDNGGRLGWLPVSNYPPQLRSLLLSLRPGEVTDPIGITNGVALFQMRGIREMAKSVAAPARIDYASYDIPGGRTAAGLQAARELTASVDTCDDLYGIARNQPPEILARNELAPADIPRDVALELARLDPGEVSYNLTRDDGQTLVFLMLCSRTALGQGDVDRDGVRNQIRGQRLGALADALLADLRAAARITTR